MANHVSHASLPFPIKGARFTIPVPYLNSSGTPTDPTTPDTEFSIDASAFADCAEEVSTITGSNGSGYITLSGAETNGSLLVVAAKVASGPQNTLLSTCIPQLVTLASGTLSAGSAGGGTLGSILAYDIRNCFIKTTGGTGGGGTGGANNQARRITAYNVSTGVFSVAPNWETAPDATTTYDILLPEGVTVGALKALLPTTDGRTLDVAATGEAGIDFSNALIPTTGAIAALGVAESGTMQAGSTSTSAVLRAATSFADNVPKGFTIYIYAGTGAGQARVITSWTNSTDTATVDAWTTTPDNTSQYLVFATAPSSGALDASGVRAAIGMASANMDTQLSGISGKLPTALVSGRLDVSVGAYQTGLAPLQPTVAGNKLDVSATGEAGIDLANVGSPTATLTLTNTTISSSQQVASVAGNVGGNVAGNVVGTVGGVTGLTASDVAAIKAKSDQLTFTSSGKVDANVVRVKNTDLVASGAGGQGYGG
jgi:hypothetical protein